MTVHRRGGRPNGGVGRKKRQLQRRRSTSTSDENSSEGDSITRCVCGETHNLGLMVQCDKCEVWQHCRCMGLEQPDIPDQYYCEQCKPDHHKMTRLTNGRSKRQYNALGHSNTTTVTAAPKKRMTLNSREASMSLEDVLAARTALELYESNTNDLKEEEEEEEVEKENSVDKPTSPPAVKPPQQSNNKRKREVEVSLPETTEEAPSSTVSSVGHEEPFIATKEPTVESPESIVTVTTTTTTIVKTKQYNKRKPKEIIKKSNGRGQGKRRGKLSRSRTSTPQPIDPSPPQKEISDEENNGFNSDNLSTMLFEYFSPKARASSPPAKTRHPHSRMSISEMNRRANQILEYISSIQVEMASSTTNNNTHAGHNNTDDDDNDSLSSASTIPLNYPSSDTERDVDKEKQSSMEIMDMLTRKLIKFQKRFGSRNRNLYEEALLEGEGRITRSRENTTSAATSTTTTVYRNMMAH